MRIQLHFALSFALVGFFADSAKAQFQWTQANWQLTPASYDVPPYASSSAIPGPTIDDSFYGSLRAFAENPSGPGGPSVTASITFSRNFQITPLEGNSTLTVPFRLIANGTLTQGPVLGGTQSAFSAQASINSSPSQFLFFENYTSSTTVSLNKTANINLPAGLYTVNGIISLNAQAFSGGPTASGDIYASFGVLVPVPETELLVLLSGAVLAVWYRQRNRTFGHTDRLSLILTVY